MLQADINSIWILAIEILTKFSYEKLMMHKIQSHNYPDPGCEYLHCYIYFMTIQILGLVAKKSHPGNI
jgi:hypothetical protein